MVRFIFFRSGDSRGGFSFSPCHVDFETARMEDPPRRVLLFSKWRGGLSPPLLMLCLTRREWFSILAVLLLLLSRRRDGEEGSASSPRHVVLESAWFDTAGRSPRHVVCLWLVFEAARGGSTTLPLLIRGCRDGEVVGRGRSETGRQGAILQPRATDHADERPDAHRVRRRRDALAS